MRKRWLPIGSVVLASILLVARVPVPHIFEQFMHTFAMPLWSVRDGILRTTDLAYRSLSSTEHILRENSLLREELASLRRENVMTRIYMRENERLRALVGRGSTTDEYVMATVIQDERYSPYDSFVLDVGSKDGVRERMLVDSQEGNAIGFVVQVFERSSVVKLFSATGVRADVILDGARAVQVQVLGYGAGTMRIELPRHVVVSVGDGVLLPNIAGSMLGTVSDIVSERENAYQTVYVRSTINPWELRYVRVDVAHVWEPVKDIQLAPVEVPLSGMASTTAPAQ